MGNLRKLKRQAYTASNKAAARPTKHPLPMQENSDAGTEEGSHEEPESKFTEPLMAAIASGKLTPVTRAGDWLASLSDAELSMLGAIADDYRHRRNLDSSTEIVPIVIILMYLETGKIQVVEPVEQWEDKVEAFTIMTSLEELRRKGFIEVEEKMSLCVDYSKLRFSKKVVAALQELGITNDH